MRDFRHRRGRILFEIFGVLLIASIAVGRWALDRSIVSLLVGCALTAYGLYRVASLFVRNPALGFDGRTVRIGRLFKLLEYRWSEIRDIREARWTRPSIPYMNWLPKERDYLEIEVSGAGTLKIRPDMMELPSGGVAEIIKSFRAEQIAALGERGAAMARLGAKAEPTAAPVSGIQAERLQRLGIVTEEAPDLPELSDVPPMAQPGPSPRPVFGRKVS